MSLTQYISRNPWKWTLFVCLFTLLAVLYGCEAYAWIPYAYGVLCLVLYVVVWVGSRTKPAKPVYLQ